MSGHLRGGDQTLALGGGRVEGLSGRVYPVPDAGVASGALSVQFDPPCSPSGL